MRFAQSVSQVSFSKKVGMTKKSRRMLERKEKKRKGKKTMTEWKGKMRKKEQTLYIHLNVSSQELMFAFWGLELHIRVN